MSNKHLFSRRRGFHVQNFNRPVLGVMKWSFLSLGVVSMVLSLSLIAKAGNVWAQCFEDNSVECSGGVKCSATDQVGCTCWDANYKVVSQHLCKDLPHDEALLNSRKTTIKFTLRLPS